MKPEPNLFDGLADEVSPITMRDVVYQKLRAAIVTGKLAPDERLIELRLAAFLGVSRTPLREAIRLLEQERLLVRQPQGGVRVAPVALEEVLQLNDVRAALEALVVRRAAERVRDSALTEQDRAALARARELVRSMRDAAGGNDVVRLLALGSDFHAELYVVGGNTICREMLMQVLAGMERYRALVPPDRNLAAIRQHHEILEAIEQGRPDEAEERMRTHVDEAGRHYAATVVDLDRARIKKGRIR